MSDQAPQGWYPDPSGFPGRRWWDGTKWTDRTDDAPDSPPMATPQGGAEAAYADPPGFSNTPTYGSAPAYGKPAYGAGYTAQRFVAPYAGFWLRVAAAIIDSLILGVPLALVALLLFWSDILDAINTADATGTFALNNGASDAFTLFLIVAVIVSGTYYTFMIGLRGATLGMSVAKIQVVDAAGQIPTIGRAFWRWGFAQLFSFFTNLIPFVGFFVSLFDPLWMLPDPENQTLHDKVAKTWVLQQQDQPRQPAQGSGGAA